MSCPMDAGAAASGTQAVWEPRFMASRNTWESPWEGRGRGDPHEELPSRGRPPASHPPELPKPLLCPAGAALGLGDTAGIKANLSPCPHGADSLVGGDDTADGLHHLRAPRHPSVKPCDAHPGVR